MTGDIHIGKILGIPFRLHWSWFLAVFLIAWSLGQGFFPRTLPEFRGRGLYRATVAKRAELARDSGYRWLYSDALPTSRPILERLGFVAITTTTPFLLPGAAG